MTTTVRSVDVRLNAHVTKYIRDIHRAGGATEKAFDKVQVSVSRARQDLKGADEDTDRLRRTTDLTSPSMRRLSSDIDRVKRSSDRGLASIDKLSGRVKALAQTALVLGPGAIPIGAVGGQVLAGLANQLASAGIAGGTLLIAMNGVVDATKALDEYDLDPTAANLERAEEAMSRLGPEAQDFVRAFQDFQPVLTDIRDSAAAGWFPGLIDALDDFERLAPTIEDIVARVSLAGGELIRSGAESLASERWRDFFEFLSDEVPDTVRDLGLAVGSTAHALAELWMAADPLNDDFSTWLVEGAAALDEWATHLDETEGFRDFLDYVKTSGPQVGRTLGAFARAGVDIAQAMSPLGGPVLGALESVAKAISTIAESPLGPKLFTMAAAFVILNKTLAITAGLLARTGFAGAAGALRGAAPGRAGGTGPAGVPLAGRIQTARTSLTMLGKDMRTIGTTWATVGRGMERQNTSMNSALQRTQATMTGFGKTAAKAGLGVGAFAVATGTLGGGLGLQNTAMLGLVGAMAGPWGAAIGAGIGLTLDFAAANRKAAEALLEAEQALSGTDIGQLKATLNTLRESLTTDVTIFETIFGKDDERLEETRGRIDQIEDSIRTLDGLGRNQILVERLRADAKAAKDAGEAFRDLSKAYEAPKQTLDDLIGNMRAWGRAARDMGKNIEDALVNGAAPAALTDIVDRLGPDAALALEQLANGGEGAANRLNTAFRRSQNQIQNYEGSVSELRDGLRDMPAPVLDLQDGSFRRKIRQALDSANVLDQAKVNPFADMNVSPLLAAARRADRKMRDTEQKGPKPRVDLQNVPQAFSQLEQLTKPRTVRVSVAMGSSAAAMEERLRRASAAGSADGSTVPKDGGPYRDRYPYLLAPGEEVISNRNGQADRHRPLLKAINAGRLADGGTVQGLAGGGTVLRTRAGDEAAGVTRGLAALRRELAAAEKAVASERKQRDLMLERRTTLRSGIRQGLDDGIWRAGGDAWASGGPLADLRADLSEIATFDKLTGQLKKKGVTKGALDAILAEGDLATVQAYAGMSKTDLATYVKLYNTKERELNRVSASGADAAWGPALRQQNAELQEANVELKQIKSAVNRGTRSNRQEQAKNRAASRKGAGRAARGKSMGYMP